MGLVPTSYRFIKKQSGNVSLEMYNGATLIQTIGLQPGKDLRVDENFPENIIVPIITNGGHANNKFIGCNWKKIDFANSDPTSLPPANIHDAINLLMDNFFFLDLDFPANLSLYATTATSDIPGYIKLVTNITNPDYNDPAVDVPTGVISGQNQLLSELAADPAVFIGNPGVITISTVGEIRRTSGTGLAEFYFEAYLRDSGGTETLIGISNNTAPVSQSVYTQFQASLLLNNGVFTATDRLVLKFYGNRIAGGSNPQYDFLFGGTNPVRTLFPIAAGLISNVQSVNGFTGVVVLNATDVGAYPDTNPSAYISTVAVDGVTITGDGTVGNPLVSVGGGGLDQLQVVLNSQVYS
jgi:hypothetical protein